MSRLLLPIIISSCFLIAGGAHDAHADGRGGVGKASSDQTVTDFDAYTRDQLEHHEPRGRKPAGWVGPWPPRAQEPPSTTSTTSSAAAEPAPGGGDLPSYDEPVFRDVALPPAELHASLRTTTPAAPTAPLAPSEVLDTETADPVAAAPEDKPAGPASSAPSTASSSKARKPRTAAARAAEPATGPYSKSTGGEQEPVDLYTRVGVVTLVEFKNGERPSGGAFCGNCAVVTKDGHVSDEGMFIVEQMVDKVSIRPREVPLPGADALLTNLHIVTDTGRTITFELRDADAMGVNPTQRHEIRASKDESSVLTSSVGDQVARANRLLEANLRTELAEIEKGVVAEKASRRMDTYTDVEVIRKASGRKLLIEGATTLGDETVIRMRIDAAPGELADPVAILESDRGRARILRTRSVLSQPEGSALVITLSIEGVVLGEDQRIAVSILDPRSGEELRSSVGRS